MLRDVSNSSRSNESGEGVRMRGGDKEDWQMTATKAAGNMIKPGVQKRLLHQPANAQPHGVTPCKRSNGPRNGQQAHTNVSWCCARWTAADTPRFSAGTDCQAPIQRTLHFKIHTSTHPHTSAPKVRMPHHIAYKFPGQLSAESFFARRSLGVWC
eukprot:996902-Pelagomonas_calceolata.AAC.7